jgi:hypothetical protein
LIRPQINRTISPDVQVQPRRQERIGTFGPAALASAAIKVSATQEGLPAIQQLISEGINVNITLLFGLARYRQVAEGGIGILSRAKGVTFTGGLCCQLLSESD